jgi:hypothetical protein
VLRIDDGPEQADRDGLHAGLLQVFRGCHHVLLAQGLQLVAHRVDTPAHLAGTVARHVRRREVDLGIEGALARRFAQGEDVRVARIADQADRRHLAFDQGVGGNRGAVDDEVRLGEEVAQLQLVAVRRHLQHVDEALLEFAGRGRGFEDLDIGLAAVKHQIGESAADIDTGHEHPMLPLSPFAAPAKPVPNRPPIRAAA